MASPNKNVVEFLEYYCSLSWPPKYATLVAGKWGSGKSFLVKNFFASRPELKTLYVSLYGMKDIADIENAFFAQLHPTLSRPGMRVAAAVAKGVLKNLKIDLDFDLSKGGKGTAEAGVEAPDVGLLKFLSDSRGRILIFDDLERVEMPIKKVLGYINTFVEHDDSKVIVIANEQEILSGAEKDEYGRTKEKLIGKSFEVRADLQSGFDAFVSLIGDEDIKKFYIAKKADIETIFNQSGTDNLRILQQTMWDFERLARAMEPAQRQSADALSAVFGPYFALSFEMKAHRLSYDDVIRLGGPDFSRALRQGGNPSKREQIEQRYPEVKFGESIIGMDVMRDVLFKSAIDGEAIRELLSKSKFFADPKNEPAWRALWFSMSRSDNEAKHALDTVEEQFRSRHFSLMGELLHVFGLRLWASRIGAIPLSPEDVVRECKDYVDDLYAANRLEPAPSFRNVLGEVTDSYEGLGFMERETDRFREIASYLDRMELRVTEDRYPQRANELLEEMKSDVGLFIRRLCLTNSADNVYASVPILTYLAPEEFVENLMALDPEPRRTALIAFGQRYSFLQTTPALIPELEWLGKVEELLRDKANALPPISSYALNGAISRYVSLPLQAAREQISSNRGAGASD